MQITSTNNEPGYEYGLNLSVEACLICLAPTTLHCTHCIAHSYTACAASTDAGVYP